jgi:hypothetical protein
VDENDVDEREIQPTPPPPPVPLGAPPGGPKHRVAYTVKDNVHYYELGCTMVVIYGHLKQGLPVSSLFLPHENTDLQYDF